MEISRELVKNLQNCIWLENCATDKYSSYMFDVCLINNLDEAIKNIESVTWENLCLDQKGEFTGFLAKNYKNDYNRYWNKEVKLIKKDYLPLFSTQISIGLKKKKLPDVIIDDINFNILLVLMLNFYAEYYKNTFFNQILEVYLSGHLPCGWSGKYPDGKLIVY